MIVGKALEVPGVIQTGVLCRFENVADALSMIRVLVRDQNRGDVPRLTIDRVEAFLDDLGGQPAVDHEERRTELDEGRVAAAAARERDEP